MTNRVELTPEATRDLIRLEDFLLSKSPIAARRASAKIASAIATLSEMPERAGLLRGGRRELVVPFNGGNYAVRYRIQGDIVLIGRIFHNREIR